MNNDIQKLLTYTVETIEVYSTHDIPNPYISEYIITRNKIIHLHGFKIKQNKKSVTLIFEHNGERYITYVNNL